MWGVLPRAWNMFIGPFDRISSALLLLSVCKDVMTWLKLL